MDQTERTELERLLVLPDHKEAFIQSNRYKIKDSRENSLGEERRNSTTCQMSLRLACIADMIRPL